MPEFGHLKQIASMLKTRGGQESGQVSYFGLLLVKYAIRQPKFWTHLQ